MEKQGFLMYRESGSEEVVYLKVSSISSLREEFGEVVIYADGMKHYPQACMEEVVSMLEEVFLFPSQTIEPL